MWGIRYGIGWVARFWGQAYYAIAGLVCLIFIFVVDGYLKDGRPERDIVPTILRRGW